MIIDTHGHLIPPDLLNTIRKEGPKLPSLRIGHASQLGVTCTW